MSSIRLRLAAAAAVLLGAYACGGDGIVLPDESIPAAIAMVDGDAQVGPAGSALTDPLVVQVTDARGRPVENQEVAFAVVTGAGQVTPATATTNADGLASATWTLGGAAGAQRVRAQVTGSGAPANLTVDFNATALAGSGSTLILVSGDAQSGPVGSALPEPLVVRVVDPLGNPVSGQTIAWSVTGGGSIDPPSSVTGADGEASAQRVLGPSTGVQTALATAEGLAGSPVTFTHTAGATAPTSFVRVSGNAQTAPAGFQLPDSLVVRLLDANGNGVGGRTVTWVVGPGAGVVDPVNSQTDAEGFAVTRWTLGPTAGAHSLNAVFSGLPSVSFSATATADVPTAVALLSGDGQTAPVGTALPQPLRVKITDANGNAVENVSVTWTAVGGGSVSASTTGSDAQGIAQVTRTLGPTPGTYTTTAEVAGLTGSPVTFTSTAQVGAAARLAFLSQPGAALVGQALSFQVEIQDAQGNRVTTAGNQITITSSRAGTLNGDNVENAVNGVATFDALSLDEARTGYTLNALSSGLSSAGSLPFDISRGSTTVVITGRTPPGSSVTGQSVLFNYDVDVVAPAAGNLNGTVTVSDGTQSCTSGTTNAGVGSCSIAFATAGARTVTATYNDDDPNFTGSVSPGLAVSVNKANATVNITSDLPDPSVVGNQVPVEFAIDVGGAAPTGTVTIAASVSETCSAPAAATGSCLLTLTAAGVNRTLTATYDGDANYNGDTDTELHTVSPANAAPTAVDDSYSVAEEGTLSPNAAQGVLGNDTDDGPLTASVVSGPTSAASFTLNADGSFSYSPVADFNGEDSFTYEASDGSLTDQATVTITVTAVNDPPSFTKGGDQTVSSVTAAGGVTVENWATAISPGPGETGQTVSFQVSTNGNDAAFSALPAVSPAGTLTFATNVRLDTIVVTVTVTPVDNLGLPGAPQDFTITIDPI